MAYYHGVRVQENATSVVAPVDGTAGLQVIVGVAPVNLAEDPYKATNTPIVAHSFDEAAAAVGYCDDFADYSICESIDASFRLLNVAPIVLINVLDPDVHNKAMEAADYAVENGTVTIPVKGILADKLVVTAAGETLTADVDYVVTFDDDGYAVVSLVDPTKADSLNVSGTVIDPSQITYTDIIGSYDVETGVETGLEVIRQVFPKLGLVPGLIVCPKWSADPNVAAAMANKCEGINGVFSCEAIVDLDCGENGARKYTDVEAIKKASGLTSPHISVEWPCVKAGDKMYHSSAVKAALTAYTDAQNDDVPNLSPSNKAVGITAICLEDGTELILDEQQANVVNSVGVCTWQNFQGFVSWGNNTAAYPEDTDQKDRWFCCRRFFSWWGNSFILLYHEKVDSPANYRQVEAIVDAENVRGNSYVAQGKCAGAYIEYREEDNTVEDLINGKVKFYTHLAPYTPMEDILNVLEFDPSLLEAALSGGEE